MVLDEPSADDEIFKEGGITYAISKELYEQVKPIQLDFVQTDEGIRISDLLEYAKILRLL